MKMLTQDIETMTDLSIGDAVRIKGSVMNAVGNIDNFLADRSKAFVIYPANRKTKSGRVRVWLDVDRIERASHIAGKQDA